MPFFQGAHTFDIHNATMQDNQGNGTINTTNDNRKRGDNYTNHGQVGDNYNGRFNGGNFGGNGTGGDGYQYAPAPQAPVSRRGKPIARDRGGETPQYGTPLALPDDEDTLRREIEKVTRELEVKREKLKVDRIRKMQAQLLALRDELEAVDREGSW